MKSLFIYPVLVLFVCSKDAGSVGPHRYYSRLGHVSLRLKGGDGHSLAIPDDFPTMEKALKFFESERITNARVMYRKGEYRIGAEEYDGRAIRFESDKLNLRVDGEKGTEISGHWNIEKGNGLVSGLGIFDVVKLEPDGFHIDELGNNCISVEGGVWTFEDCEIQSSGTALRALEKAKVSWIRCITGGSARAKMPPTNYTTLKTPDFLRAVMAKVMHRDPVTGLALNPEVESAMPRYGVTAWGDAHVRLQACVIRNMTFNGVCCTGSSTVEMEDCVVSGCGMAGVYMEGDANATLTACHFKHNFICLSVWGGFGEERLFKTTSEWEPEPDVLVDPNCSMRLVRNRFTGRTWAGYVRPARLEEDANVFEEDAEEMADSEAPVERDLDGLESLVEVDDAGDARLWRLEDPVSIPAWAPQGRAGGDGVSAWIPRSESMAARLPPRKPPRAGPA